MMLQELFLDNDRYPLFKNVSSEQINKYFPQSTYYLQEFDPNQIAYSEKSETIHVAFILDGSARVYTREDDESALLRTLNTGDIFGIANLYDGEPFPSYIVTATKAKILFVDGNAFKDFLENTPAAMKNYLTLLSDKIMYLNKKIAVLTAGSAEKKLASYIYEHMINGEFIPDFSISELATILQMGRASLYRALDVLTDKSIIVKRGKRITVIDKDKLKNYK